MKIKDAEKQRKEAEEKINAFIDWVSPSLISEEQREAVIDMKFNILGYFDAEISHSLNLEQLETERKNEKLTSKRNQLYQEYKNLRAKKEVTPICLYMN